MVSARARPLEVCQLNLLRVYQLRSNLLPKFFRRHPKMTVQNDMSFDVTSEITNLTRIARPLNGS
jgi:hypothetical protein